MKNKMLYKVCRSGIFAAIICALSFINFPLGAVPVTLATLGIMVAGAVLPPLEAVMSTITYVLIGLIGIPVFSGGSGGIGVLLGPTGGYIWSYPILALLISLNSCFCYKSAKSRIMMEFVLSTLGMIICYALGTTQYMLVSNTPFIASLFVCVIPFIPIDIIKLTVGILIGLKIKYRIN